MRRERPLRAAIVAAVLSLATVGATPPPSPSPSPSTVRAAASPRPERLAIASCPRTIFYAWAEKNSAPFAADYPPASIGDAFHIVGDMQQTLDGIELYETTIDVIDPWGAGKHYWVSPRCINGN